MEKITVVEIIAVIVILIVGIGAGFIVDYLAERFHKAWLSIASLVLSVVIVIIGIVALIAWGMRTAADALDKAMSKGYPVYVNGIEVSEEEAREALTAGNMCIDDEAQMVQIATITDKRNHKWHKGDPYETVYINGEKADPAYVSPDLYDEKQVFYDEDTKTLYIIAL